MPHTRSHSRPDGPPSSHLTGNPFEPLVHSPPDSGPSHVDPETGMLLGSLSEDPESFPSGSRLSRDRPPHLDEAEPSRGRSDHTAGKRRAASPDLAWRKFLREERAFLAGQQATMLASFQTMMNNVLVATRPAVGVQPVPGPLVPSAPKLRLANPEPFDGSSKNAESFLNALSNYFLAVPSQFPTTESMVRFALSFMNDNAVPWRDLFLKDVRDGRYTFSTWADFETLFRTSFGNPHRADEAQQKLFSVKQGSRTAEEFFIEFEVLRLDAGLCENTNIFALRQSLRSNLLKDVLRSRPTPVTYLEWKEATLDADRNARRSESLSAFFNKSAVPNRATERRPFLPFRRPPPPSSSTPSPTTDSKPSTDQKTSTSAKFSNLKALAKVIYCWGCGKPGHTSRECKEKKFPEKARALLEELEKLDLVDWNEVGMSIETVRRLASDEGGEEAEHQHDECREIMGRVLAEHPAASFFVDSDE